SSLLHSLLPLEHQQNTFWMTDETGWTESPLPDTPAVRTRVTAAEQRNYTALLDGYRLDQRPAAALDAILKLCRTERLPAALRVRPEGPAFRRLYSPGAWAQVEALLADLSRRHGVPIINAREWMSEDDFLDAHHLASSGAAVFSERLAREAIAPLLAPRASSRNP